MSKKLIDELRERTPRVIYRDDGRGFFGRGRPSYQALRLIDVRYQPAHKETYSTLGDSTQRTRKRPTLIAIGRGGSSYLVPPSKLGEYLRRPTAAGLRRLEEAEAELRRATKGVRDAERAAFTYGRPVTVAAVQAVTREHKTAWNAE